MATAIPSRSKRAPENPCANCGHPETEHGTTGTRPCLAAVGEFPNRDFCRCDHFRPQPARGSVGKPYRESPEAMKPAQ